MPLTQRSWSINNFCSSKIWYKTNVMDLRASDISSITSKIKSWLYSDQFEKPEEIVVYRPNNMGGLNIHNIKYKAMAMLIRSFLETSINPKFIHIALFNRHVLLDNSWLDPGIPPFFSQDFFSAIRNVHETSPLNIATMTSRQWYHLLLEDNMTMVSASVDGPRLFAPCKAEKMNQDTEWEKTWRLARMKGLDSNQTSFLWKLLHALLPTLNRVNRISPNTSPICQHCNTDTIEDIPHALFHCSFNSIVSQYLLNILSRHQPDLSFDDILCLNFKVEDDHELPFVWITSTLLSSIWSLRKDKKKCDLIKARADLEAKVSLLRKTKFKQATDKISKMLFV